MKDKSSKRNILLRYGILFAFLLFFSFLALEHQFFERSNPSVDALCPFGGIETFFTFITSGGFVPRILISSLILSVGVLLTVLVLRRGFCGYICPFGTIQELLGKITKKKITVPPKLDKYARYLKYAVLVAILVGTAYTGTLVFRSVDPFITFFHFGKGLLWGEADESVWLPLAITFIVLSLAVFIERFWCRYLCPLGATMAIFSKIGLSKITRDKKTCIDCKLCDKNCPVKVDISTVHEVKSAECINCNTCVNKCPVGALSIKIAKKKISVTTYTILLVAIFFAVIGFSMLFSIWESTPGQATGKLGSADIRGWMNLEDVSNGTGIPVEQLIADLNLTGVDTKTPLNKIASTYNLPFDTETVRNYLANKNK